MSNHPVIVAMARPLLGPEPRSIWPDRIRPASLKVADAAAIHALLVRAYANGYGAVQSDWLDWFEWLTTDPEFDQKLCFLARNEAGQLVGFCLVWTSSFVKDLVVEPAMQGQGIGSALLATAIAEMHERGATQLRLKVDARNLDARRFYERMGFVEE